MLGAGKSRVYYGLALLVILVIIAAQISPGVAYTAESNSYLFDMGTSTSPVEAGYRKVEPNTVYQEGQFGWVGGFSLNARDRTTGTNVTRDFVFSAQPAAFKATVENGKYRVEVLMGDMTSFHDKMAVKGNGQSVASEITTNVGEIKTVPFDVDITNGILELEFSDGGGSDANWTVCAVRILSPGTFEIVTKNLSVDCTYVTIRGTSEGITEKMWFEVYAEAKNNQMVDFGSFSPDPEWFFTARHMGKGNNKIVVFAKLQNGIITSKYINVKLELGDEPAVRPRPAPAEIWWGGVASEAGMNELTTPDSQWEYVKKYQDTYLLHASLWFNQDELAQSLTQYLKPYGTKYRIEIGGGIEARRDTDPNANVSDSHVAAWGSFLDNLTADGFVFSEVTHDYRPEVYTIARYFPEKSEQEIVDMFVHDWGGVFKAYSTKYPYFKTAHTQCPLYWGWAGYQAIADDKLTLTPVLDKDGNPVLVNGETVNKYFNMADIMAAMMQTLNSIGMSYDFYTDCPNAFLSGKTYGRYAPLIREKIRAYENWFQSNGGRHTQICNAQVPATVTDDDEWHRQYMTNAFDSLTTVQKDGGRSDAYLFESWSKNAAGEWMPKKVAHEDEDYTFTNLAKRGLKYLKGIKDVDGNLEKLSFTITPKADGMTVTLKNDGDVMCLPAIAAYQQAGNVNTIKWTDDDGNDITGLIYSPEGWTENKTLEPGAATTIACTKTDMGQDAKIMLEAFWNPQDPTGIVRDRKIVVLASTGVQEISLTTPLKTNYDNNNLNEDVNVPGEVPIDNTNSIRVKVDNQPVSFEAEPCKLNGCVMVPFREIFEELGVGVSLNEEYQQIIGTKGDLKMNLTIGSPVAMVGNTGRLLDAAPIVIGETTFVPIKFITEALGLKMSWDEGSQTISIDSTPTDIPVPDNQPVYQLPGHPSPVNAEDRRLPNAQPMTGEEIPIVTVNGIIDEAENSPQNSCDGNLETHWSGCCNPYSADATYDLGAVKRVSGVSIALYLGYERTYYFDIQTSTDGVTWNDEYYARSSNSIRGFEGYKFTEEKDARYIRITGYGNRSSEWFGVDELKIHGEVHMPESYSEDFTGNMITNPSRFTTTRPDYVYYDNGICKLGVNKDDRDKDVYANLSTATLATKSTFGPVSVTADVYAAQSMASGQQTNRNALFIGMRVKNNTDFYNTADSGIWFSVSNLTGPNNMFVGNATKRTSVDNPLDFGTLRRITVVDSGAEILVFGYDDSGAAVQIVKAVVNAASVDIYPGTATTNPMNLALALPSAGFVVFQGNFAECAVDNITIQEYISENFAGNKINQNHLFRTYYNPSPDTISYAYNMLCMGIKADDGTPVPGWAVMRTAEKYGPISLSADISCVQDSRGRTNRNALFIGLRVSGTGDAYNSQSTSLWFSFSNLTGTGNMYIGNVNNDTAFYTSITHSLNFGTMRTVRVIDSGSEIKVYGYNDSGIAVQLVRAVINPTTVDIYQGTDSTISKTLNITLPSTGYVCFQGNNATCMVDNVILSSNPYFPSASKTVTMAFTDIHNTLIASLTRNTILRTTCTINNYEGKNITAQLIGALYDKSNTLVKALWADPIQIPKYAGKSFYVDMQLPDIDLSAHKVKAFVWDDISTMKPLQGYTLFPA